MLYLKIFSIIFYNEPKGGDKMKGKILLVLLLGTALATAGCESMGPKTKTGAVAGGALGAIAGGVIGQQISHNPLAGAAIGAAVGAIGGGLLGNSWDQQDKEAKAVNPNHLPLTKIAEMAKEGTPDAVIISEIDRTHSVYALNSEIIGYLKQNKVSDKVIDYMMNSAAKK